VPETGHISLTVYNILGEKVSTLFEGVPQQGYFTVMFDADGLASGVYLYRLKAEDFVETKKLILTK
jgi:hypothetical protein